MPYIHPSIVLNNQTFDVSTIIASKVIGQTDFEVATLAFIRHWLTGEQSFQIRTSGSTGAPKEIIITRKQMANSARRTAEALDLKAGDTALVCLNTNYIAGKMMLVRALECDLKIIATEPSSDPLANIPSDTSIDFMAVVPIQLQVLLTNGDERLNTMKAIIVGGASVSSKLESEISNIKSPVYATYGMTETISHVALQLLNTTDRTPGFKTLRGVKIKKDERGCLIIEDENLNQSIITNDLVEIYDEGHFRWIGRWDNIINTGGVKVSPEKIEKEVDRTFNSLGIKRNFFVGAVPNESLGNEVVLIVEGEIIDSIQQLLSPTLKESLNRFELPKQIRFVPTFVYTATGKINRPETLKHL